MTQTEAKKLAEKHTTPRVRLEHSTDLSKSKLVLPNFKQALQRDIAAANYDAIITIETSRIFRHLSLTENTIETAEDIPIHVTPDTAPPLPPSLKANNELSKKIANEEPVSDKELEDLVSQLNENIDNNLYFDNLLNLRRARRFWRSYIRFKKIEPIIENKSTEYRNQ
ncbi:MAG: hypothetical protein RIB30_11185 [Thalassospira sp.]|uniref:hypothetical protein n=1 Tax=Thalassospira sp. TaxID=1912094 RepID=UPI0032EE2B66